MMCGETVVSLNYTAALNKTYKLTQDIMIAFTETDNTNLEDAYDVLNLSNLLELKKGDEILLIDVDTSLCLYYVELPDGRRGVFTDQLAG